MIIRELRLNNFGIYGGHYTFNLSPIGDRPVVLFRGKNGVGKSTIMEALRLALHGPLALGGRVGRAEYLDYLAEHIHRPLHLNADSTLSKAGVTLVLDYFHLGRKITYRIDRLWHQTGRAVSTDLHIFEGEHLEKVVSTKDKDGGSERAETFLREIVPPSTAELFFFDAERLQALTDDVNSRRILADIFKATTGLTMVEQLQRDLELYTLRNMDEIKAIELRQSLEALRYKIEGQKRTFDEANAKKQIIIEQIETVRTHITECEQEIAQEGQWFADRRDEFKTIKARQQERIENYRRRIQELCSGVLPFVIAAPMCHQVAVRLKAEEVWEKWNASIQVLDRQIVKLEQEFASDEFWAELEWNPNSNQRHSLLERVRYALTESSGISMSEEDVILRVSEQQRNNLLLWIEQLMPEAASTFGRLINRLEHAQKALQEAEEWLKKAPDETVMQPLHARLSELEKEMAQLQSKERSIEEEVRLAEYWLNDSERQKSNIEETLGEGEKTNQRIELASRVRRILTSYRGKLTDSKLRALETRIAERFNLLCRKENFIEGVHIDPRTFAVSMTRSGRPFARERLSAGEKQLLATATMWAIRDVSGLPLPLVVDTPMGRLDSEHRNIMLKNYLPHASHQVIVLSTDMEIDQTMMNEASQHISYVWGLQYNDETGRTEVKKEFEAGNYNAVRQSELHELVVNA